jgi:nucleoside-diphosphate-sugar epimerase
MILVTGATGLVGSHLIKALLAQGRSVRALYRSEIPTAFVLSSIDWVKADILDIVALEEAMVGVTQVYHCAAIVSFNAKNKKALHLTNIEGTANIVNACLNANVKKLLFVSSVAALGRIREDQTINESMNWTEETSNSEYGKSKYLAEIEVWRGMGEGLNVVVVNPVIILGDSDWTKGSTAIFKSAYDEFPWYTEGSSGFVDVIDVVDAMVLLMDSSICDQRFILSGANLPYKDVFTMIATGFHKKAPHKKVTALLAEIVWRIEGIKGKITGKSPLLTKETSRTARSSVQFDNSKLLMRLPLFQYRNMQSSIERICTELKARYNLS